MLLRPHLSQASPGCNSTTSCGTLVPDRGWTILVPDPAIWQLGLLQQNRGLLIMPSRPGYLIVYFTPSLCAVLAEHASAVDAEFCEATLTLASSLFPASPLLLGPAPYTEAAPLYRCISRTLGCILAVFYYSSWWDCGGMKFKTGGINPNCCHPMPRLREAVP